MELYNYKQINIMEYRVKYIEDGDDDDCMKTINFSIYGMGMSTETSFCELPCFKKSDWMKLFKDDGALSFGGNSCACIVRIKENICIGSSVSNSGGDMATELRFPFEKIKDQLLVAVNEAYPDE